MPDVHPSVHALWSDFLHTTGRDSALPLPPVWSFSDNAADADELADLVVRGIKRATAPSVWELEAAGEPIPRAGDLDLIVDARGIARCIIETTHVEVVSFDEVPAAFAAAEGEGDGSLAYWRRVHEAYYARVLDGTPFVPRPDMPIVCQHFRVVYPSPDTTSD